MKKLYYYSKAKLQFIEIQNFKSKITAYTLFVVITFSLLTITGYFLYSSSTSQDAGSLKAENRILKNKIEEISSMYKSLNNKLEDLERKEDELRISANLPPVSEQERKVGVGGGYFDLNTDFFTTEEDLNFKEALSYIDEVSRKVKFEEEIYNKISRKLIENEKLYDAMPAIKPCAGYYDQSSFGIRMHPILKINKMHDGVDIITDIGTPVYASAKGIVDFAGNKGGFGLAIELEHGFGYRTVYAHLSSVKVKSGQKVSRGTLIGYTGNSGLSSGPHLHYEVHHNGIILNPVDFFFDETGFFALTKK